MRKQQTMITLGESPGVIFIAMHIEEAPVARPLI